MSDVSPNRPRIERYFQQHFVKIVLIASGFGAFWMLKARLQKTPIRKPPEIVHALSEAVNPMMALSQQAVALPERATEELVTDGLVDGAPEMIDQFEVPDEALRRFNERIRVRAPIIARAALSAKFSRQDRLISTAPVRDRVDQADNTFQTISIEANWDVGPFDDAVDEASPLLEIFNRAAQEVALLGNYSPDARESLVTLDESADNIPKISRMAIGVWKRNSFDAEKSVVAEFQHHLESNETQAIPKPIVSEPSSLEEPEVSDSLAPPSTGKPIRSVIDEKRPLDAQQELASLERSVPEERSIPDPKYQSRPLWNEKRKEEAPFEFIEIPMENIFQAQSRPTIASAIPPSTSVSDFPGESILISPVAAPIVADNLLPAKTGPLLDFAKRTTEPPNHALTNQPDDSSADNHHDLENDSPNNTAGSRSSTVVGVLELSDGATGWLEKQKGHIELYLQAVGSRDMQDTIFLDYQFPERDFEVSGGSLRKNYHLIAAVYVPGSATAYSTIPFPGIVNRHTMGRLHFRIDRDAIAKRASQKKRAGTVPLTLAVFEALSGNYRKPPAVDGATIEIVGLENGNLVVDTEGTVRISAVPVHSEFLVRASAPGFYPTERIIPVFETSAYYPIYLIPTEKINDITHFFTRSPQEEEKSLVVGRVFDTTTRTPKSEERFWLSYRRGGALYFGALPDPALSQTTTLGLFGFFNIVPAFRVLTRQEAPYGLLTDFRAGHGYYVEWGRGGERPIRGRIEDPFNPKSLHAKVSWLEKTEKAIETDLSNRFEFDEVDLQPGIVTLVIDVIDYPKIWHNLAWSTRERVDERVLHVLEKDLLRENAKSFSRREKHSGLGTLIGGAATGFFTRSSCVLPRLLRGDGTAVTYEEGPYYFSKVRSGAESFCLTAQYPGFSYVNLTPGEYVLQFFSTSHKLLRSKVVRLGGDRVTIAVQ